MTHFAPLCPQAGHLKGAQAGQAQMDSCPSMLIFPTHSPVLLNPDIAPKSICSITFVGSEVRPDSILLLVGKSETLFPSLLTTVILDD